jgi:outer membrane protein OmpA-like peptidoglycan-associated protein
MAIGRSRIQLGSVIFLAFAIGPTTARAACEDLVAAFERAVATRSIDDAQSAAGEFANQVACLPRVDEFRGKLVDFLVSHAAAATTTATDRARAIAIARDVLQLYRNWAAAAKLADYYMQRGDKLNGYRWYEQSVLHLGTNPVDLSPASRSALLTKLAAAKSLVNDDEEGAQAITYVTATRDEGGGPGGIYSRVFAPRGVEVINIPIPINFYTNETRFTPTGEKALQEFLEAARDGHVRRIKLVGHADPRGPSQHNMDLSRRRVEAVRDELQRKGIGVRIVIEWKGASQRFDIRGLPYRVSEQERWQLDRRVEWVRDAASN